MNEPERRGNFTKQAIKVLRFAQREAERLQHNYIGTEHLLLGLVREKKGAAAKVLSILGMDLERGRNAEEARMRTLMFIRDPRLRSLAPPTVPAGAASLVGEGESVLTCDRCSARCPSYFRYCFNCGQQLGQK